MAAHRTDPIDIAAWHRIDACLTTSGQPTGAQLSALASLGVQNVVNLGLHTHEQALPDEGGSLAALGIAYIHIPVAFDAPTQSDYDRFRSALRALTGEMVHVHCIANLRVSAFLYRYRRDEGLASEADARADMERLWRPGGVWAAFIGDAAAADAPHRLAGRDY